MSLKSLKLNNSDSLIHIIVTVVGVIAALAAGLMIGGGGGDVDGQIGDLKSDIEANKQSCQANSELAEANKQLIQANKKLAEANKASNSEYMRKFNSLSSTFAREMSATRTKLVSADDKMSYVDKVLGLEWFTRYPGGHRYCLTPYPLPWKHAQAFAEKIGGNLVVINDEEENKWIVEKFGTSTEYWIGLTDERDEGKWLWVNDLDSIYTNWAAGEPDNYRKMQHYVILNKQQAKGAEEPGKWNDIAGNEIKIGIVEVEK